MIKGFLILTIGALSISGSFAAFEKNKLEQFTAETDVVAIDNSESEILEAYHISLEEFPTKVYKQKKTHRSMTKYADLSKYRIADSTSEELIKPRGRNVNHIFSQIRKIFVN